MGKCDLKLFNNMVLCQTPSPFSPHHVWIELQLMDQVLLPPFQSGFEAHRVPLLLLHSLSPCVFHVIHYECESNLDSLVYFWLAQPLESEEHVVHLNVRQIDTRSGKPSHGRESRLEREWYCTNRLSHDKCDPSWTKADLIAIIIEKSLGEKDVVEETQVYS